MTDPLGRSWDEGYEDAMAHARSVVSLVIANVRSACHEDQAKAIAEALRRALQTT